MTDHPGKAALATIEKHVKDMEGRGPVLDGNFGFTVYKDQFQSIAAYVAELETALAEARKVIVKTQWALQPFSDCVFNDNGDCTVTNWAVSSERFIDAYFAYKQTRAWLQANKGDV
jgi:hypothetical protein